MRASCRGHRHRGHDGFGALKQLVVARKVDWRSCEVRQMPFLFRFGNGGITFVREP